MDSQNYGGGATGDVFYHNWQRALKQIQGLEKENKRLRDTLQVISKIEDNMDNHFRAKHRLKIEKEMKH